MACRWPTVHTGQRTRAWLTILQVKPLGFIGTGSAIVKKETALGLYKGLGAVLTGIIPKMAIRFTSYEQYKQMLAKDGQTTSGGTFIGK
jgi:solute carrier family 25 citrate transporter 1